MDNLGWFSQGQNGAKQVNDAAQYGMFSAVRSNQPQRPNEIQKTGVQVTQMTPQLQDIFKKSLKSNRWDKIDLGTAQNYTHENMVNRWVAEKNKWLHQRQPKKAGGETDDDVRGPVTSGPIPQSDTEPVRLAVRRTMKQLSGPYSPFEQYYPLEDAIELYNEIWYESSSSDE